MRTIYVLDLFIRFSPRAPAPLRGVPPGMIGFLPVFDTLEAAEAERTRYGLGEVVEFDTDDEPAEASARAP